MTWAVVGASAGLGRALAEALARDSRPLLLVASDKQDLDAQAADLRIRFGGETRALAVDVSAARAAEEIATALEGKPIDGLLFPVGAVDEDDDGRLAGERLERLMRVNLISIMTITARLLPRMRAQGRGVIVGFGSVAAARGRSRNVVYSAAKRALESYFESLRHAEEACGIAVALYVVGFMDTNQAFGRQLRLPLARPEHVARRVRNELGRRRGRSHLPRWWWPVTCALRALPWPAYRRMRF